MQLITKRLHAKYNHTSIRHLIQVAPDHDALEELVDFPLDFEQDPCHACLMTKVKHLKLPHKTPSRAPYPNYRWYLDLTGKMRIKLRLGNQYAGCCVDCSSNDVQPIILKKLRTDGAGENTSAVFEEKLASEGTFHEKSAPHWQHQNGRVENVIYCVSIRSNAMARTANTPACDWDETWQYACLCESVTKQYDIGKKMTACKA
eukprot:1836654-Rhodomonas_salina.2